MQAHGRPSKEPGAPFNNLNIIKATKNHYASTNKALTILEAENSSPLPALSLSSTTSKGIPRPAMSYRNALIESTSIEKRKHDVYRRVQ